MHDSKDIGLDMDPQRMSEMKKLLELAESARVNTKLDRLQTELDNAYRLVGKLYVSRHKDAARAEFSDIVMNIDDLEQNISELRGGVKAVASESEEQSEDYGTLAKASAEDDFGSAQEDTPDNIQTDFFGSMNSSVEVPGVTMPISAKEPPDYDDVIPMTGFVNLDDVTGSTQPVFPNDTLSDNNKANVSAPVTQSIFSLRQDEQPNTDVTQPVFSHDMPSDNNRTDVSAPVTQSIFEVRQTEKSKPAETASRTGRDLTGKKRNEENENADYFDDDDDDEDDVQNEVIAAASEDESVKSNDSAKYTQKTVRCESCGAIITSGQNICTECGKEIDWSKYRDENDHSDEEPTTLVKTEGVSPYESTPSYNIYAPSAYQQNNPSVSKIGDVGATVPVGDSPHLNDSQEIGETQPIEFVDQFSNPFSFNQSFDQNQNFGGQQELPFNQVPNYNAQPSQFGQNGGTGDGDYLSNQGPTIPLNSKINIQPEQGQAAPLEAQSNQGFSNGDNKGASSYAQGASFDVGAGQGRVSYCPKCGHRIDGSYLFCTECGTKLQN